MKREEKAATTKEFPPKQPLTSRHNLAALLQNPPIPPLVSFVIITWGVLFSGCATPEQSSSAGWFPEGVSRGSSGGISGIYFSEGIDIPIRESEGFGAYTGLDGAFFEPTGEKEGYVGLRGKLGVKIGLFFLEAGHGCGYRHGESWKRPVDYTFPSDVTLGAVAGPELGSAQSKPTGGVGPGSARPEIWIGIRYLHFSWGRDKLKWLGLKDEGPNGGFETVGIVIMMRGR